MKRLLVAPFCALLLTMPAAAESGRAQMSDGMRLFFDGMMKEITPLMEGMKENLKEAVPKLRRLITLMGDLQNYEAPEMLPNGDIIIRRKVPRKAAPPATGQTDL